MSFWNVLLLNSIWTVLCMLSATVLPIGAYHAYDHDLLFENTLLMEFESTSLYLLDASRQSLTAVNGSDPALFYTVRPQAPGLTDDLFVTPAANGEFCSENDTTKYAVNAVPIPWTNRFGHGHPYYEFGSTKDAAYSHYVASNNRCRKQIFRLWSSSSLDAELVSMTVAFRLTKLDRDQYIDIVSLQEGHCGLVVRVRVQIVEPAGGPAGVIVYFQGLKVCNGDTVESTIGVYFNYEGWSELISELYVCTLRRNTPSDGTWFKLYCNHKTVTRVRFGTYNASTSVPMEVTIGGPSSQVEAEGLNYFLDGFVYYFLLSAGYRDGDQILDFHKLICVKIEGDAAACGLNQTEWDLRVQAATPTNATVMTTSGVAVSETRRELSAMPTFASTTTTKTLPLDSILDNPLLLGLGITILAILLISALLCAFLLFKSSRSGKKKKKSSRSERSSGAAESGRNLDEVDAGAGAASSTLTSVPQMDQGSLPSAAAAPANEYDVVQLPAPTTEQYEAPGDKLGASVYDVVEDPISSSTHQPQTYDIVPNTRAEMSQYDDPNSRL